MTITDEMNEVKRLFDIPTYQLNTFPNPSMFVTKTNSQWISVSTNQFLERVNAFSLALIGLGVAVGEKVAIVASNRVEWNILDIAIQQIGAIVVPVYPNISSADYRYIFNDAAIRYAFLGSQEIFDRIDRVKSEIPSLETLFLFDEVAGTIHFESLLPLGDAIDPSVLKALKANVRNEDLATIIYTSGTTGNPKGVMLSHANLLSNVIACQPIIPADEHSRVLSFLPVCHVYERMLHYLYMYCGSSIYFAESMETIGENIREVKPQVFTAVPRLIEKVFDRIMAVGDEQKGIKRALFFWAVRLAEEYDVIGKSAWYQFKLLIARKLIFKKWQAALGGEVKAIASGSAALQPRLARIFLAAGIPILEGYGLSETSPVVSVNCLKKGIRIGTVGKLIDGVKVRFGLDGEILVKGPNVMMGYYNLPEETSEAMDAQGWFHTGDIGELQEGEFLKITDRKKEIFKTSGGKYIIPQAMENTFKESRFIEQMMVIGEGQKFPAALVVPNFLFLKEWAHRKQIDLATASNQTICQHPAVINRMEEEVEHINQSFGNWEQLKKIVLLPEEFTIDGGELTPTLKLKRKIIAQKYAVEIEGIYQEK
jgi:long-chain acyl-CoA synthetase